MIHRFSNEHVGAQDAGSDDLASIQRKLIEMFSDFASRQISIKNMYNSEPTIFKLFSNEDGLLSMVTISKLLPNVRSVVFTSIPIDEMMKRRFEIMQCIAECSDLKCKDRVHCLRFRSSCTEIFDKDPEVLSMIEKKKESLKDRGWSLDYQVGVDGIHCITLKEPDFFIYDETQNQYEFDIEAPLRIVDPLKLPHCQVTGHIEGKLAIQCRADIIIEENAVISAMKTQLISDDDSNALNEWNGNDNSGITATKRKSLAFRPFIELLVNRNVKCEYKAGAAGGDIRLLSAGNITNDGTVCCDGDENWQYRGGVVFITADCFVNNGIISSIQKGSVQVICSKFINSGIIVPEPMVIIGGDVKDFEVKLENEQAIPLEIYDHRGHFGGWNIHHPANLLVDSMQSDYCSQSYVTHGDWIIFKLKKAQIPFKPSGIMIRNSMWNNAIKCIALWMGKDDGRWFKLCENITGIHNDNTEAQGFDWSLILRDEFMIKEQADMIIVEVVDNHGSDVSNRCYSFQVFGHTLSDEE